MGEEVVREWEEGSGGDVRSNKFRWNNKLKMKSKPCQTRFTGAVGIDCKFWCTKLDHVIRLHDGDCRRLDANRFHFVFSRKMASVRDRLRIDRNLSGSFKMHLKRSRHSLSQQCAADSGKKIEWARWVTRLTRPISLFACLSAATTFAVEFMRDAVWQEASESISDHMCARRTISKSERENFLVRIHLLSSSQRLIASAQFMLCSIIFCLQRSKKTHAKEKQFNLERVQGVCARHLIRNRNAPYAS